MSQIWMLREYERKVVSLRFRSAELCPSNRARFLGWYTGVSKKIPNKLPKFEDVVANSETDLRVSFSTIEDTSAAVRRLSRVSFSSIGVSSMKYVDREALSDSLSGDNQMMIMYEKNGLKTVDKRELRSGTKGGGRGREVSPPEAMDNRFSSASGLSDVEDEEKETTPIAKSEESEDEEKIEKKNRNATGGGAIQMKKGEIKYEKEDRKRTSDSLKETEVKSAEVASCSKKVKSEESSVSNEALAEIKKRITRVVTEIGKIVDGTMVLAKRKNRSEAAKEKRNELTRLKQWEEWIVTQEYEVTIGELNLYLNSSHYPPK